LLIIAASRLDVEASLAGIVLHRTMFLPEW
jgi:hypothetical protein